MVGWTVGRGASGSNRVPHSAWRPRFRPLDHGCPAWRRQEPADSDAHRVVAAACGSNHLIPGQARRSATPSPRDFHHAFAEPDEDHHRRVQDLHRLPPRLGTGPYARPCTRRPPTTTTSSLPPDSADTATNTQPPNRTPSPPRTARTTSSAPASSTSRRGWLTDGFDHSPRGHACGELCSADSARSVWHRRGGRNRQRHRVCHQRASTMRCSADRICNSAVNGTASDPNRPHRLSIREHRHAIVG